jgi:putative PIN family toxin of toxin-antitoxin system
MRVVLDTNTAVSGLLWAGAPRQILDAARADVITLHTSPELLEELADVLSRPKFTRRLAQIDESVEEVIAGYRALCTIVTPESLSPVIRADPDDDAVVACAVGAHATIIVSGDGHLLDLANYGDIQIVTSRAMVELLAVG